MILDEPIRFSKVYARLRGLFPAQEDVSDFEHPLVREELETMIEGFKVEGMRYFRLPFVPLVYRAVPSKADAAWRASDWSLRHVPPLERYATTAVARLRK